MTKIKTGGHTAHSRKWFVELNIDHLKFLCTPTKQGASRLASYMDLLASVAETDTFHQPLYGQPISLEAGQVVISITDLSDRWKWARETVRKYLDQLADFNLLTKQQLDRCSLITMKMTWEDASLIHGILDPAARFLIPKQLNDNITKWMNEELSKEKVLGSIEDFLLSEEINGATHLPYLSSVIQYETIRQLIRICLNQDADVPAKMDAYSENLISRVFNDCLSGKWEEWLQFIDDAKRVKLFYPSVYQDSRDVSSNTDCRDIFVSLLNHLNVVRDSESL